MNPEIIPNDDILYYHISINLFASVNYDFSDIPPHAFTPIGRGLSTNWNKYCKDAETCLAIKTESFPEGRKKSTHGVGHFNVKDVRDIQTLDVIHSPSTHNISHSEIIGIPESKPKPPFLEMRKKLKRIFQSWDIEPEYTEDI